MVTVRAIAELAGVSVSTVSLVLNNKEGVSDAMRRLVLDARDQIAAQLEHPATASDTLPRRRMGHESTLSLVILHPPILRSSYVFSEVLRGIEAAAEAHHIQLRLVANDPQPSPQHVAYLYFSDPNLRPDGVIVFGARQHEPLIEEARRLGIPCVVLGRDAAKYAVSGVGRNEERCAYEAARYLVELGHRAIGFVGGEESYDYVLNRIKGYRRALDEADIKVVPAWIQLGNGDDATENLLKHAPEITALLFVNDTNAAAGLPVLLAAGVRIPNDMSVISFDDTDVARNFTPPLTSVSYRRYEEGQWAVKMLIDQIRFPFIDTVHTRFHAELVKRDSCAVPRST
jgi:LacI family transcriptional regulator